VKPAVFRDKQHYVRSEITHVFSVKLTADCAVCKHVPIWSGSSWTETTECCREPDQEDHHIVLSTCTQFLQIHSSQSFILLFYFIIRCLTFRALYLYCNCLFWELNDNDNDDILIPSLPLSERRYFVARRLCGCVCVRNSAYRIGTPSRRCTPH